MRAKLRISEQNAKRKIVFLNFAIKEIESLNGYLKRSLRVTTFWNALLYWLFASPYVVTSTG